MGRLRAAPAAALQAIGREMDALGTEESDEGGAVDASSCQELWSWVTGAGLGLQPGMGRIWTTRAGRGGAAAGLTARFELLLERLGIGWPMCDLHKGSRVRQLLLGNG